MTTVGMNYEVREGKAKAFEKQFVRVLEVLRTLPGHVSTYLYLNAFQPQCYVVLSEWEKREDFDRFVGSDAFRAVAAWGEANILATRPKHVVYEGGQHSAPAVNRCPYAEASAATVA